MQCILYPSDSFLPLVLAAFRTTGKVHILSVASVNSQGDRVGRDSKGASMAAAYQGNDPGDKREK